jgi:quercetin dioxygenase-like cupin family protein
MKYVSQLILVLFLFEITRAQPSPGSSFAPKSTASILLEQTFKKDIKVHIIRIETVTFPAGYHSKSHTHPCPIFVYVLDGELLSEFEGVKKVYKAGETFYEKANGLHSITQNNNHEKAVTFLVFYLMKDDVETFIPKNLRN